MRKLLFMVLFVCSAFAKAQLVPDLVPTIEQQPRNITDTLDRKYDERKLEVPPLDNLQETYTGREFEYNESNDKSQNFISELLESFFKFLADLFGISLSPFWAEVLTYVVYALMGAFAIYLLVKVLSKESPSALLSRRSVNPAQVKIEDAHIEQVDLTAVYRR